MQLYSLFSRPPRASKFDHTQDKAVWAMSLVDYWITHPFRIANCNGFYFTAYPLGLQSNGNLCILMMLFDPPMNCMYLTMMI